MDDIPKEKRLVPTAIDFRAQQTPERIYAFLPKGDDLQSGFFPLNYSALSKAINATAWWLDGNLGGRVTSSDFPTIAYTGANDFRYVLLLIAAMKTHRKLMVPLLYNTKESSVRILKASECVAVLASESHEHLLDEARAEAGKIGLVKVPELDHFIHDKPVEHYPYDRDYDAGCDDPMLVIQTGGTTGNAKLLVYSAKEELRLSLNPGPNFDDKMMFRTLLKDAYCTLLLPLSWSAGLNMAATFPVYVEMIPIILPSTAPLPITPSYLNDIMIHRPKSDKDALLIVPDVLRETTQVPEYLERLKEYDWIGFAGAPLDHSVGDKLSQFTRVQSLQGNTEVGNYPLLLNDAADWKLHRFHPTLDGYHFQHFTDDLYELCVKKEVGDTRACFQLDPDIDVFHTKDLYRQVAGRESFWQNAGRSDDYVKLATLSKFNAIEIEQVIVRDPQIATCIVAGDARKRPFALIQPSAGLQGSSAEIIDRIWPAVEEANQMITNEAQIPKNLILLTKPDAPIKRTIKGTIDRRNTLPMYGEDIESLYVLAGYT